MIRSYLSVSGLANVPRIELVCKRNVFENTHEAIVDKGTWELVQEAPGNATPHRHVRRGEPADRSCFLRRLQSENV